MIKTNKLEKTKTGNIHSCKIELSEKKKDSIGHVNAFKMKMSSTLVLNSDNL